MAERGQNCRDYRFIFGGGPGKTTPPECFWFYTCSCSKANILFLKATKRANNELIRYENKKEGPQKQPLHNGISEHAFGQKRSEVTRPADCGLYLMHLDLNRVTRIKREPGAFRSGYTGGRDISSCEADRA